MCPPDAEHINHAVLEAETSEDSGASDLESIYDSESGSITDTLASFVTRYTYLEGRRFDSQNKHIASNDEIQQDQLDLFHDIYYRVLGKKLYLAPIGDKPQRILDCGTGTGIWAVDMADMFPSAAVIGNDVSPIQPQWVPANCTFEVDDFNQDWTHTKESFDFVHARACHGSVTDWGHFCKQAFKVLKPGGWLEVVDEDACLHCDDGTLPPDTPIRGWLDDCKKILNDMGRDPVPYPTLKGFMDKAGFNMRTYKIETFHVPIGTWPKKREDKEIGGMMLVNMLQGIDGWSVFLWTKVKGTSVEEYHKLLESWKIDLKQRKHHKYMNVNAVYAQKPFNEGETSEHTVA